MNCLRCHKASHKRVCSRCQDAVLRPLGWVITVLGLLGAGAVYQLLVLAPLVHPNWMIFGIMCALYGLTVWVVGEWDSRQVLPTFRHPLSSPLARLAKAVVHGLYFPASLLGWVVIARKRRHH